MRWVRVISIAIALSSITGAAIASQHAGYWRKITVTGKSYKCEGVYSESQMVKVLKQAGWPTDKGIPSVSWSTEEAVVIAPSSYHKDGRLALFGLDLEGDAYVLKYGWVTINTDQVGASSATFGSNEEGKPETIVVSYRRGLDSGRRFVCRDIGFQR